MMTSEATGRAAYLDAVPSDPGFAEAIEALTRVRTRELRLPPAIHAAFRHATWPSRKKIIRAWLVSIAILNALCFPLDPLLADQNAFGAFAAARFGLTVFLLAAAWLIHAMAKPGLEGVIVIVCCAAVMFVAGATGLSYGPELTERYIVHAAFVAGSGVMVTRIAWRDTLILTGVSIALFCGFLLQIPDPPLSTNEAAQMALFYGGGLAGLTFARRAHDRLHYRVFVLTMSERLKMREIEAVNSRLFAMARTDPLTSLSNRRHFDEVFGALRIGADERSTIGLFMIDVDRFKQLNDELGHAAGDERLAAVAGLIRSELREGVDFVARFGGEEFVVLLPDVVLEEARAIAERVRASVENRALVNPGGLAGVVTVSIGVAAAPPGRLERLIEEADAALYAAKQRGRNRVELAAGQAAETA
ncbi:diguanylate cyclase [Methylopila henanensis]|uniref:diguanylate cyclase n=1 Tax=Methylopila henanensis TaxID=873516 RepID=A0ABW4K9E8_9HYPH